VEGGETLFLKETYGGTFAVPRDWTDIAEALTCGSLPTPILAFERLLELAEVVAILYRRSQEGLDT